MCAPAAQVNRECDEVHDLNGIHIPKGTGVVIPIYVMHHDPDAWEDPKKFNPERFRGPAKDTPCLPVSAVWCWPQELHRHEVCSDGDQNRPGENPDKFKFVRSPETQIPLIIHPGGTLSARDGVMVRVQTLV